MATSEMLSTDRQPRTDWVSVADALVPILAARAPGHDADDTFVADNFAELRRYRLFSAPVPSELGGGGASPAEMCDVLRTLAHGCSSTALALSMHTHQVLIPAWRWRHERAPVDAFLRRVAASELILASSGGSDWLAGSGRAEKVDGGYRVTARKIFASGSPAADLFSTMAVYDDPAEGPTVLHFMIPFDAPGVKVHDNWRTLGMRATGSNDVTLDGVFVPDAAVGARRPSGRWSHPWHIVAAMALPAVYSVYVGVAEAARDLALREAARRRGDAVVQELAGAMENELTAARLALRSMIEAAGGGTVGPEVTSKVLIGRALAGQAVLRTVDAALEVAGGAAFFRSAGLERLFRDAQGARYHALRGAAQHRLAGRLALGLTLDE
ncbi:MAG TPA: acyl-CoA dehydrogenase family protein [Methylomirabilota bacterium]|nr:acyl-CoA dehydrogenase family protein [Methylomirabilota bacterium]